MKKQNLRAKVLNYTAIFQTEEEGGYSVTIPELPGCISQGETFEEALDNIKEAAELWLEDEEVNPPRTGLNTFIVPITVKDYGKKYKAINS